VARLGAPAALAASAALHGALLAALARAPALPPAENVAIELVAEAAPPPAAPEPTRAPPPLPEPARPARLPPPRIARAAPPVEAPAPVDAPPPPNAPPPPAAPPPEKAPVRIGISMSASTSSGGVAAPAGNTLYGEAPASAPDPADVTRYLAAGYAPPTAVTTLPRALGECRPPEDEYPPDARRDGIQGKVVLRLLLDAEGRIAEATVIQDPGHGLGAAAVASVKRHCRFEPARRGDEKVATWIPYTVRYELP
jgi:protein TonB